MCPAQSQLAAIRLLHTDVTQLDPAMWCRIENYMTGRLECNLSQTAKTKLPLFSHTRNVRSISATDIRYIQVLYQLQICSDSITTTDIRNV